MFIKFGTLFLLLAVLCCCTPRTFARQAQKQQDQAFGSLQRSNDAKDAQLSEENAELINYNGGESKFETISKEGALNQESIDGEEDTDEDTDDDVNSTGRARRRRGRRVGRRGRRGRRGRGVRRRGRRAGRRGGRRGGRRRGRRNRLG